MVKPVHERMPVILEGEGLDAWLSDTDDAALLKSLLVPYAGASLQSLGGEPQGQQPGQ